jgi:hypothetical protein
MNIDKHTLWESAQTTHFPKLLLRSDRFCSDDAYQCSRHRIRFLPMPTPAYSRKEWEDLRSDPDELQKIIRVRFGQN